MDPKNKVEAQIIEVFIEGGLCMRAFLFLTGCGGTWVDDRRNFERPFRSRQPEEVTVKRSIYWQSPHYTEEHCFYLELEAPTNSGWAQAMVLSNGLPKLAIEATNYFPTGVMAVPIP